MKSKIILSLLIIPFFIFGQNEKGATPIPSHSGGGWEGATRAVVIGISDYRDDRIPDLNFAHKDAEAFKAYLQSPAGGELPRKNIQLLTNEKATTGQMVAAMGWLVEESRPGDKAIIYFSGHGDVERISKFQRGYLLTHDSPPNNYMAGAFPVFGLQDIISTLSEMDVQVVMVSDACRAGKLAGSNVNGTQATSAVLAQQFANEIKILSCQPEEFSLEGKQWGGGRGCFSYHLLDGLYGLADKNTDEKINLLEIERYLEDKVMTEAAPHSQIPMTVGSKTSVVANVDKNYLEKRKEDKKNQQPILAGIDSKGIEEVILENADTSIQKIYDEFLAAIENGHLMEPEGQSANGFYEILIREKSIEKLHGFMRRNFAAALQDESQKALHDLFYDTEKYIAEFIHSEKKSLKNFAAYLNKAAELLGKNHYMYNSLKARQYYFATFEDKEKNKNTSKDSIDKSVVGKLKKGLTYNPEAAFIYRSLGKLHIVKDTAYARDCFDAAVKFAPDWAILHADFGLYYRYVANFDKALIHLEKAIELDSNLLFVYQYLYYTYSNLGYWDKWENTLNTIIEIAENKIATEIEENIYPYDYYLLGAAYARLYSNPERAEQVLEKALKMSNGKISRIHVLLAEVFVQTEQFEKAKEKYLEAIKILEPNNSEPIFYLGNLYNYQFQEYEKADSLYELGISKTDKKEVSRYAYGLYMRGMLNLIKLERLGVASDLLKESYDLNPHFTEIYLCLTLLHQAKKEVDIACKYLDTYIVKKKLTYDQVETNEYLTDLRNTPEFKALMKKHFPNQHKD